MLFGYNPFERDSHSKTHAAIIDCKWTFPSKSQVSEAAKDLITKMLDPTAERRITTERALQHAWITGDALTLSPQAGEELSTEEPGKEGVSSVRSALSRFNARRAMEKVKSGARRLSIQ